MTTTFRSSFVLMAAVLFLTGYSFMSAAWSVAPANPPSNNAPTPLNVSATAQTKQGNLTSNIFNAATQMRSPAYCDETGNNCFDNDTIDQFVQSRTCPTGQFMRGVNADGTLVCSAATTTTGPTCTTQTKTASSCGGTPSCGTGWTKTGPQWSVGKCSTNNDYQYQSCIRTVCS
jgi:hypothetical protein